MKNKNLLFALLTVSLISCRNSLKPVNSQPYWTDHSQVVVTFDKSLSEGEMNIFLDKLAASDVEWLSPTAAQQDRIAIVKTPRGIFSNTLASDSKVRVLPVRIYESVSTDPVSTDLPSDLDHISQIHAQKAWEISQGEGVTVAITDDGFDFEHEDLKDSFWQNPGETGTSTPGDDLQSNGIDDDGNGYIDDFRGWDMGRDDNNSKPEYSFHYHGTFVSGIIAASKDNNVGTIGVAPKSKIMPLKYRVGPRWTSVDILRGYKYAADQGARIINTSYDLDLYADDAVFLEALDYAYKMGVLIVNSAGNNKAQDSPRQSLDTMLVVCGLGSKVGPDSISDSSNFGKGIDLCAPSTAFSSKPKNKYDTLSGTSFSAAMVSGTAALIWSKHPDYSLSQVVATLLGTAESVDFANEGFAGKLGSGRLDAYRAISAWPDPPSFRAIKTEQAPDTTLIRISLRGILDPDSVAKATPKVMTSAGTRLCQFRFLPYFIGSNELLVESGEKLTAGEYSIDLSGLKDPFGQKLSVDNQSRRRSLTFTVQ